MDADAFPGRLLALLHDRHVLVGFSGGLDSTVLLHACAAARDRLASLRAIHIDHGLHPDAGAWAAHCRARCAELEIDLLTVPVQVLPDGRGIEAAARQARMAAFAANLDEGEVLALAQHRDDQVETVLLRLLRGSGADGMAAMRIERRFGRGLLVRPLLDVPRAALVAYAAQAGLHWIEDPSNLDTRFDRNHLRHAILPALRARWPQADAALATSARLAAEDAALLAEEATRQLEMLRLPGCSALSLPGLRHLSAGWRARVIRQWLADAGLPTPPARLHARIDTQLLPARLDAVAELRWPGAVLRCWRGGLYVEASSASIANSTIHRQQDWDGAQQLRLPDGSTLGFEPEPARDRPTRAAVPAQAAVLRAALARDFGSFVVGARRGGERMRLPGRSHRHQLKHLLQSAALPPWRRDALPLLFAADGELLAAGDALIAARLADWGGEHALRLRWRQPAAD